MYLVPNELLPSIHRLDQEVEELKDQIKTVQEALQSELEQSDTFQALQDALDRVKQLRQQLKVELMDNRAYNQLQEELAEHKFNFKDLQEILSHHLVQYFHQTEDTQVPVDEKVAKPILIKAKLGKEEMRQDKLPLGGGNDKT